MASASRPEAGGGPGTGHGVAGESDAPRPPIPHSVAGPVIARTSGKRSRMWAARAPRQPVTITRPFSARASSMAHSDSSIAASINPQVLTTTRSASS